LIFAEGRGTVIGVDTDRTYAFGSSRLSLSFGSILTSKAEVLVSSDDYRLSMGGGVSAAIGAAAGSALVLDAAKSVPRRLGDVVVTTGGALDARYVFHVVTIGPRVVDGEPRPADADVVRGATRHCLSLLGPLGVSSIAFPALGTGVARFSMSEAAAAMAEVVAEFLAESPTSLEVSLMLHARPGMSELDFVAFYEQFAVHAPRVAEGKVAPLVAPPPPVESAEPAAISALLELERERQVLEQRIVQARRHAGDSGLEGSLNAELLANQAKRLDVATQEQGDRSRPVNVFLSYAHEDKRYRERLVTHFATMMKRGVIQHWDDRAIVPGSNWDNEINTALDEANIVLFLISADFMASGYIDSVEIRRSFERHGRGEAILIPVLVRATDWRGTELSTLQALPGDGKPISEWPNQDKAYVDVVEGVARAVADLLSAKPPLPGD
jgi:O-acetyl-ADP-ribose deacetylase (regulator of RNase III)